MNDRVFEMFGGQQVFCDRCISSCFLLGAGVQCEWLQRSDVAGWSFALSAVASTSIGSIIPFALKNIMMTIFRGGSLAVRSWPSFNVACCGSQDSAAVRPVDSKCAGPPQQPSECQARRSCPAYHQGGVCVCCSARRSSEQDHLDPDGKAAPSHKERRSCARDAARPGSHACPSVVGLRLQGSGEAARGAAPRRQSGAQCSRAAGSEGSSHATSASHDGHNGTCKAADSQQSCQ